MASVKGNFQKKLGSLEKNSGSRSQLIEFLRSSEEERLQIEVEVLKLRELTSHLKTENEKLKNDDLSKDNDLSKILQEKDKKLQETLLELDELEKEFDMEKDRYEQCILKTEEKIQNIEKNMNEMREMITVYDQLVENFVEEKAILRETNVSLEMREKEIILGFNEKIELMLDEKNKCDETIKKLNSDLVHSQDHGKELTNVIESQSIQLKKLVDENKQLVDKIKLMKESMIQEETKEIQNAKYQQNIKDLEHENSMSQSMIKDLTDKIEAIEQEKESMQKLHHELQETLSTQILNLEKELKESKTQFQLVIFIYLI